MTFSLNGPEFEGKTGAQGVGGWNHPRPGQMSGSGKMIEVELNQIRNKEKETPEAGGEPAGRQREGANISDSFYGGSGIVRPLIVQTPWQGSESFFMEDLTDSSGTESDAGILEDFADLIDRVVFLSQLDDSIPSGGLAGTGRRPTARRGEKAGMGIASELMTEHPESSRRIPELGSHPIGRLVINEIGSQGFILPLLWVRRFEEKPPALC